MAEPTVADKLERLDAATADLSGLVCQAAEMIQKIKQIKFHYLTLTCDLYTRMDFPSIIMDICEKEVRQIVPSAKDIRSLEF